ncbi:glycosyltransferase [Tepidanaerobacter sp. EBM-38]|uniref:glycosyltransferase n=1 Tax=Tepidanaerobacter sp. EBM-38 TaxID=1918496 RepID=UPI000B1FAE4F|nr:glycosyltransferase [Tepidanaerobacter sp. EBM-38]
MIKVLIGTTVRRQPEILKEYLMSLKCLDKTGLKCNYFFIDDNIDNTSKNLLKAFQEENPENDVRVIESDLKTSDYIEDENTHYWREDLIWKVARNKNIMLKHALKNEYDYAFLVDSDIFLHPLTLKHLISLGKDIVSEIFWTKWDNNSVELPQVWLSDQYNLFYKSRDEKISSTELNKRTMDFINKLKIPGVYKVGGLGACTLISKNSISKGVSYSEIYNLTFWGEDRHFCVRAAALGIELFVDTHFPAFHIYRKSDLKPLDMYKRYIKDYPEYIFLPGNRLIKENNNKLTLAMIIKNEADRYLKDVLLSVKDFISNAVIIDDGSTDNSEFVCKTILAKIPLIYHKNIISKFSNEIELRKQLWNLTLTTKPDWILCLDADEIFEEKIKDEIDDLINQPHYDVVGFKLFDFWNEKQYREDKYWNAHLRYWPFLIRYQPFFEYKWKESSQHCGRFPMNITELPSITSEIRIKHMGWAKPEDRLKKYNRYLELDKNAQYGIKEQYETILDKDPHLIDWKENVTNKTNPTLSLCIITKDEEKNISRCINSVKDIVDEIVVVDTGSKDRTAEIAESLGARVIHEKWQDDFSKARNTAIEHAKSDWILFMDADEEVKKEDVAKILPLLNDDTIEAYTFKFVNYGGSNVSDDFAQIHYNFKLFRNNGKLKYVYPIHENLKNVADDREPIYKKADITILHYGYLSEIRIEKNKTQRYIKMISDYLLEHPNDMFQHVNLGVEYFNAGEYRKAIKHLMIAQKALNNNPPLMIRTLMYLISAHSALKEYEQALSLINYAAARYPQVPDFRFLEGNIYIEQKRYQKAVEMFTECLSIGEYNGMANTTAGTGSYKARYMIAFCYEKLGQLHDAVQEYTKLLIAKPGYGQVFRKLFEIFVKNETPETVREFFDKYVEKANPANFAILAQLYLDIGEFDTALQYLEEINVDIGGLNNLKGIAYMGLKKYEDALKCFEAEFGKSRNMSVYYTSLCYIILKNLDRAKDILWELEDSADKKLFLSLIGDMRARLDDIRESFFQLLSFLLKINEFELFNDVLNIYNIDFGRDDYARYGKMMQDYGFEEPAVQSYIIAAERNCQNAEVYRYLAQKAMEKGMNDDALVMASNALNLDKTDIDNYMLIYRLYTIMNKNDEAELIDKIVKEMYPEINLEELAAIAHKGF